MNNSITNSDFQHVYEFLNFEDVKTTSNSTHSTPNSSAQIHRKIAAQLYFATNSGKIDEDPLVAQTLLDHHLLQYNKIVDQQDSSKGLDNYSKGALALCSSARNESKSWSLKDLKNNGTFQKLESSLKAKQPSNLSNVVELDKTMDFVAKLETTKSAAVEEIYSKPAAPSMVTRLKPSPIEHSVPEFKPIPRPQPVIKHHQPPPPVPVPTPKPVEETVNQPAGFNAFRTAREQLIVDQKKKNQGGNQGGQNAPSNGPGLGISRQKTLGTRRGLNSPFILPIKNNNQDENSNRESYTDTQDPENKITDERLKNIDPKMIELIENEIMDNGKPVNWDDIAGLEFAKKTIKEIVVWPMLRPDIFTGLRGPPRGILLFGPPGTGKTLIGKCIASQSKSTFFSISASSLTSKWVGEGEKMVRALFAVARVNQPSVIFIDEIDSLLSQRSDTEHESSRRIKTEFLVQLDGATTSSEDRLLVVGATNRPQELDEAARRRLVKRLYIPLPEFAARKQIIQLLMAPQRHDLNDNSVNDICHRTDGYSCADMTNLCKEAAYGPIRSIPLEDIEHITPEEVRPIINQDFEAALAQVRASVSTQDLALYEDWNNRFGSGAK